MKLDAGAIFEDELARRGLAFERDGDDGYRIRLGDVAVTVNLENVRRNAERDGDPDVIRRFVDEVLRAWQDTPGWEEASHLLLFSAESADHDFADAIRSPVTEEVSRVLTLTDRNHSRVTWVTAEMCAKWGVSPESASVAALRNQDELLAGLNLEVEQVDGHKLGMVPLDSAYKASVIFAPSFRELVAPELGWPVWVVIPCRDFIYVIAEQSELVARIGEVVVREFRASGYPITTEVLRVSDDGIDAIGHFPAGSEPKDDD